MTTDGYNTFVGEEAGNLTMGSTATSAGQASYNTAMGYQSLRSNTTGYQNATNGAYSSYSNTTGYRNTANGYQSFYSNLTGYNNTASGYQSLYSNTSGVNNTASGHQSLYSNTTSHYNTASGNYSLYSNVTGASNTASGYNSLYSNNTGSGNVALGRDAGHYQANGGTALTDPENSVYLGYGTRGFSNADSNSIVIGYQAIGIGANSVVLGNDSITTTALKGNVGIGTTTPWRTLSVNGTAAFTGLTNDGTGYYACISTSGELATSTTACGASSERFKTNINDLTYGLDTVLQLRPVSFSWKSDFINSSSTQIGFIAEEVNSLIPEVIGHDDKGTIMNLDYPKLTAVLVGAMQELMNTLDQKVRDIVASISEFTLEKLSSKEIYTNKLCVDDLCIGRDDFKKILINAGIVPQDNIANVVQENTTAPIITITGNNPAVVEINSNYIDLGATAVDNQGNSLIVDTHDLDTVDTTTAGEYTVTYTAYDGTLTSTSTRTVLVEEATPLETTTASSSLPLTGQATESTTTETIVDSL